MVQEIVLPFIYLRLVYFLERRRTICHKHIALCVTYLSISCSYLVSILNDSRLETPSVTRYNVNFLVIIFLYSYKKYSVQTVFKLGY